MLRNSFIVFIFGWIIWFWIEKPRTGLDQFLRTDDNMLVNFQRFFDLLKSGYFVQSYIFIWNAHYIILSLIIGVLISMLYGFISDYLRRKRTRSFFNLPSSKKQKKEQEKEQKLNIEKSIDKK